MIIPSKLIATFSLFLGRTCKPNFQGNPLAIHGPVNSPVPLALQWFPENTVGGKIALRLVRQDRPFANGEFLVPFTGQPDNTYNIKMTANTDRSLQLAGWSHGDLAFVPIAGNDRSQNFAIDCEACSLTSRNVATNCVISHPATGLCTTAFGNGLDLGLAPCDRSLRQLFSVQSTNAGRVNDDELTTPPALE